LIVKGAVVARRAETCQRVRAMRTGRPQRRADHAQGALDACGVVAPFSGALSLLSDAGLRHRLFLLLGQRNEPLEVVRDRARRPRRT